MKSDPRPSSAPIPDRCLREAAAWFARMRGPAAASSQRQFESWLAQSPEHRQAYNRAAEVFALGKLLGEKRPAPTKRMQPRRVMASAGLAAALALLALFAIREGPRADRSGMAGTDASERLAAAQQVLSTSPGQTRSVRLADGSTVTLQGDTQLLVQLGHTERRLTLVRGEAGFDVAHAPRPFTVYAGGGRVTALGTRFVVAYKEDRRIAVRLIEGRVEVVLPTSSTGQSRSKATAHLVPGQAISFAARPDSRTTGTAGGGGLLGAPGSEATPRDYAAVSIARLIADANQGSPRPILLTDAAIAQRQVSGRFAIDDTDLLAARLATLLDLEVDRSDPRRIVLRSR